MTIPPFPYIRNTENPTVYDYDTESYNTGNYWTGYLLGAFRVTDCMSAKNSGHPIKHESRQNISVVIPVYNEARTVGTIVSRVWKLGLNAEIIVVDDGSKDETPAILSELEKKGIIKVCTHPHNMGKGAALKTGFALASGDIIIVQDGDLEYDPSDYPALIAPILAGKTDVVYGSRFLKNSFASMPGWRRAGNRFVTFLCNVLHGTRVNDMETCYKSFRKNILKGMSLKSDRFGFEPEFTIKISRKGCRIWEVPIRYKSRTYAEGKKITWKDSIDTIFLILRLKFQYRGGKA